MAAPYRPPATHPNYPGTDKFGRNQYSAPAGNQHVPASSPAGAQPATAPVQRGSAPAVQPIGRIGASPAMTNANNARAYNDQVKQGAPPAVVTPRYGVPEVPKVEVPKVEVPQAVQDVGAQVQGAYNQATGQQTGGGGISGVQTDYGSNIGIRSIIDRVLSGGGTAYDFSIIASQLSTLPMSLIQQISGLAPGWFLEIAEGLGGIWDDAIADPLGDLLGAPEFEGDPPGMGQEIGYDAIDPGIIEQYGRANVPDFDQVPFTDIPQFGGYSSDAEALRWALTGGVAQALGQARSSEYWDDLLAAEHADIENLRVADMRSLVASQNQAGLGPGSGLALAGQAQLGQSAMDAMSRARLSTEGMKRDSLMQALGLTSSVQGQFAQQDIAEYVTGLTGIEAQNAMEQMFQDQEFLRYTTEYGLDAERAKYLTDARFGIEESNADRRLAADMANQAIYEAYLDRKLSYQDMMNAYAMAEYEAQIGLAGTGAEGFTNVVGEGIKAYAAS